MIKTDFQKFAASKGINSLKLYDYNKFINGYISPTIIEERPIWVIDKNMPILKGEDRKYVDDLIYIGEE